MLTSSMSNINVLGNDIQSFLPGAVDCKIVDIMENIQKNIMK